MDYCKARTAILGIDLLLSSSGALHGISVHVIKQLVSLGAQQGCDSATHLRQFCMLSEVNLPKVFRYDLYN